MTKPAAVTLLIAVLAAPSAVAAPEPEPYGTNDAGGIRNILPPGSRGLSNAVELGAFLATGVRPAHSSDQLPLYRDLITAPRPFDDSTLDTLFKDARFGVQGAVARTYSPRDDVTIVRDDEFGVPHIYSDSRDGAMFGIGYATAEDRLFFMDIFRHLGRAQLSSFAGGAPANRAFDALMWSVAPYTEEELTAQTEVRPKGFEEESDQLRTELDSYLAGVNQYVAEARMDPTKLPGEYAAINDVDGPDDFTRADVVATAAVAGAIFGVGGGEELNSALALEAARKRFGRRKGERVWRDFRSVDDPEGTSIVHGKRFPYALHPRHPRGRALPDRGTVELAETIEKAEAPGESTGRKLLSFPQAQSNALLVSARESQSGHALAVFGPQTGYFSPQVLVEQDVHAPGYDARGVAFPGVNLFVQLGHGRDYAWSATTSAQDIVDTFAVPLCDATHYRFRGRCRAIAVLERTNEWSPNAADQTPAGTETLKIERTALGIVIARGKVRGKPVLFTRLRSTYGHETDSGLAFSYFNDPRRIQGPRDFQRAAALVPFTFNWFYADSEHIAYQNAGANPIRARRVDASLPTLARKRYEWRRWDPLGATQRSLVESSTPARRHPRVVDQSYITDWNGKQAEGYGAADGNWGYGPVYRSKLLDDRIRALVKGPRKATLPALAEAMADAATVDLRGDAVLPWVLRVLRGKPAGAIDKLRAWMRDGAHRIDADGDGLYEHAEAIEIMDAWWPRLVRAQFEPVLGKKLFDAMVAVHAIDNHPNNHGDHVGSAWQDGWYSFVQKDLRTLLGKRVRGRWSRTYCGRGKLRRCRRALTRSLKEALAVGPAELYKDGVCADEGRDGEQACFDSIWHRPLGGITQPLIPWQNRPTFQQVVEIPKRVAR